LVRKDLLACVRSEYEAIASEISSNSGWSETLSWPNPNKLCYPRFTQEKDGDVTASDQKVAISSNNVAASGCGGALTAGGHCQQELGSISLPRDRESLMDLRHQMLMELMWLKQAISSRQQVLLDY